MEYDLLQDIKFDKFGISKLLGMLIQWLASEINKLILSRKDTLTLKAKREVYPHIIWIEPALHKNFLDNDRRKKLGAIMSSVCKLYINMNTLQLRKIWDYDNSDLFLKEQRRFTMEGYITLWKSLDGVIKLWDNFLSKKKSVRAITESKSAKDTKSAALKHQEDPEETNGLKSVVKCQRTSPPRHFRSRYNRFHWSRGWWGCGCGSRRLHGLPTPPISLKPPQLSQEE